MEQMLMLVGLIQLNDGKVKIRYSFADVGTLNGCMKNYDRFHIAS